MSAVDSSVIWVSGTHGTFLWTENGGAQWHTGVVPGAASLDFRDVHAVSLDTAYLMAAGQDTARIYKTSDRGKHWTLQYDDTSKGAFLDAIVFFDSRHGLALGDPVNGHFTVLETSDGGEHWRRIANNALPAALPNEAAFAASGTALVTCGPHDAWFATGGARVSRVFRSHDAGRSWIASETPIKGGDAAAGIFSLACRNERQGIAVGGNYSHPDSTAISVAYTTDGGSTWTAASPSSATGYLSGVTYLDPARDPGGNSRDANRLIGVGTSGTAFSRDGGRTWTRLDSLSLNVVVSPRKTGTALAAGARGSIVALNTIIADRPLRRD
ncbi:MAG: WD40/YVTN/BNR-like repeat-containing protein [Gemmatimonadaceae bacterium]